MKLKGITINFELRRLIFSTDAGEKTLKLGTMLPIAKEKALKWVGENVSLDVIIKQKREEFAKSLGSVNPSEADFVKRGLTIEQERNRQAAHKAREVAEADMNEILDELLHGNRTAVSVYREYFEKIGA